MSFDEIANFRSPSWHDFDFFSGIGYFKLETGVERTALVLTLASTGLPLTMSGVEHTALVLTLAPTGLPVTTSRPMRPHIKAVRFVLRQIDHDLLYLVPGRSFRSKPAVMWEVVRDLYCTSTRVTKSDLLAVGTTQISSYFTKHWTKFLTHQAGNYPVTCFVSNPSRITWV